MSRFSCSPVSCDGINLHQPGIVHIAQQMQKSVGRLHSWPCTQLWRLVNYLCSEPQSFIKDADKQPVVQVVGHMGMPHSGGEMTHTSSTCLACSSDASHHISKKLQSHTT